jgi:hypothetical protein
LRAKRIVRPFGDHAGSRSQKSQLRVSRTACLIGLTRFRRIEAGVWNATERPSGDQRGENGEAVVVRSRRNPRPEALTV